MSERRSFFDFDNPIYKPWVKLVIVGLCLGWGFVELSSGNRFWAALFFFVAAYCGWGFYIRKSGGEK